MSNLNKWGQADFKRQAKRKASTIANMYPNFGKVRSKQSFIKDMKTLTRNINDMYNCKAVLESHTDTNGLTDGQTYYEIRVTCSNCRYVGVKHYLDTIGAEYVHDLGCVLISNINSMSHA